MLSTDQNRKSRILLAKLAETLAPVFRSVDTLSRISDGRVESCDPPDGGLVIAGGGGRMTVMAEQHESTTALRNLVAGRRAELRLTLRQLADRCIDPETGGDIKFGWLHKLESGGSVSAPSEGQLRALAVGLQLPAKRLQDAAAEEWFGVRPAEWSGDSSTRVTVAWMNELPEEKRAELAALAEFYAAQERAKREQGK